jgi:hypothetical protein
MQTTTLTFRLPIALVKALSNRAESYGFGSLAELMSLALTYQAYKATSLLLTNSHIRITL